MTGLADKWNYKEEELLAYCVRRHLSYDKMVPLFPGRTRQAIRQKVNRDGFARDFMRIKVIPPSVLIDRDRRALERSEMSEAALRMGDPPFSQSALGGRNENKRLEEISALHPTQASMD